MSAPIQKRRKRKRAYPWDSRSLKQAKSNKKPQKTDNRKEDEKETKEEGLITRRRSYQPFLDLFATFLRTNFTPLVDLVLGNIEWPQDIRGHCIESIKLTTWISVRGMPAVTEGIVYRLGWSSEDRASPLFCPLLETGHCFINEEGVVKKCVETFKGLLRKVSDQVNVHLQYEMEEWLTEEEGSALYKTISPTTPLGGESMDSISDAKNIYEGDIEKFVICVAGIALLLHYKSQEEQREGQGHKIGDKESSTMKLKSSMEITFVSKDDVILLPRPGENLKITDSLTGTVVAHAKGKTNISGEEWCALRLNFEDVFQCTL